MRTLCGILCLFVCLYMMTFARVVQVPDGEYNIINNGVKTTRQRTASRVRLTVPKPPHTGPMETFSSMWVAIPLCFGLYCIYCGEKEHWKNSKKDKA